MVASLLAGAASAMCDQFAIIEGSPNQNQKRERIEVRQPSSSPSFWQLLTFKLMHEF